jgi:N-acetylglucosamine malate deacetylase 1
MSRKTLIAIAVIEAALIVVLGVFIYFWRYEVLPQSAVSLLKDIPPAQKGQVVLVFTPHPDDETIAAGGYIATAEKNGAEVWIALVTDGNYHGKEQLRGEEFKKATAILGVPEDHLFFLGYPDHELKRMDLGQVKTRLEEIISTVRPQIIIAPSPRDHHPDHKTIGRLVMNITEGKNFTVYLFLVHHALFPSPKGLNPQLYFLPPVRMIVLDSNWGKFMLSEEIETQKHKAILQYKSQIDDRRDPLLPGLLLGMLRKNELFAMPNR